MVSDEPGFGKPMMLWMLTKEKEVSLIEKVDKAIQYYIHKYGRQPNIALISRVYSGEIGLDDGEKFVTISRVPLYTVNTLQTNHILVGHVDGLTFNEKEDTDVRSSKG